MSEPIETEVLVVGSGIAGCAAALAAARNGADVLLATKAERPEDAASDWAQGGIAASWGDPGTFKRDVIDASAGTADPEAVDVLVGNADDAVRDVLLETLDVPFDGADDDRSGDGTDGAAAGGAGFDLAREAAHSEDRILHVDAATGKHVLRPFLNHLDDHERVEILEDTAALELMTHEGRVHGALLDTVPQGQPVFAGATVLATGGIGDCYRRSTNPRGATGDGIAMAALAGADVADMEFVQFHPTAYDPDAGAGDDEVFLVSEAVRGEGAVLRNGDVPESADSGARETKSPGGERFMPDYHEDAELAPRDVVARAVDEQREATGGVVLDVSPLDEPFDEAFPDLADRCEAAGVDWRDGIPVAPCQHFLCGGVAVDDRGRTSLDRLYAVGECACTGVHGANRLASTSLLEGLVWGLRAGEDAVGHGVERVEPPELRDRDPDLPANFAAGKFRRLRRVMSERVGLRRSEDGLRRAQSVLRRLKGEVDAYVRTRTDRSLYELRNAAVVSLLVARAAAENDDSVGCHHRREEPATAD